MSEQVNRYPLEWPFGWRRTPSYGRRNGTFKAQGSWITHEAALRRLDKELDRLGATEITLSTNLQLRLDGRPRGEAGTIADPGVALYFKYKKRSTVLACDTYYRVPDNIAAIAAHIEHLRAIERHGVGTIEQALAGYKALPADTAADWRAVLGFEKGNGITVEQVKERHKQLATEHHPDKPTGSLEKMMQINRARDYALDELGGS